MNRPLIKIYHGNGCPGTGRRICFYFKVGHYSDFDVPLRGCIRSLRWFVLDALRLDWLEFRDRLIEAVRAQS